MGEQVRGALERMLGAEVGVVIAEVEGKKVGWWNVPRQGEN